MLCFESARSVAGKTGTVGLVKGLAVGFVISLREENAAAGSRGAETGLSGGAAGRSLPFKNPAAVALSEAKRIKAFNQRRVSTHKVGLKNPAVWTIHYSC